jgi:hypothetical protein
MLKQIARAIQQPMLDHEHTAIEEYTNAVAAKYAGPMGMTGLREARLSSHRQATSGAPRIRVARSR